MNNAASVDGRHFMSYIFYDNKTHRNNGRQKLGKIGLVNQALAAK